jgi:glycosyltransferase involved in cell wall biosynthesis
MDVVARLRRRHASLQLVIAGGVDPKLDLEGVARSSGIGEGVVVTGRLSLEAFAMQLVAADVVLALRFPSHGEISGALIRALGVGRPVVVTGATPAAEEFPEGIVAPIDPGRGESAELEALLDRLLEDPALRERMGQLAREHVRAVCELGSTVEALFGFLAEVQARRGELETAVAVNETPGEGSLLGYLQDEVRWSASELGLAGVDFGAEALLRDLTRGDR